MSIRDMLSQSVEDYLKAIYTLQSESSVSTSRLAERLGVSAASVTNMVKRLSGLGLLTYASYRGVKLTEAGEKIALEIIRHHRLLETYLREIMGYDWDEMHDEAEHLEHHISEEFENKLDRMLGYPTHDPHGDPIPTREGVMVTIDSEPLADCPVGIPLKIRRVMDTDTAVLKSLEELSLLPGAVLTIVEKREDAISVLMNSDDAPVDLNPTLASYLFASTDKVE